MHTFLTTCGNGIRDLYEAFFDGWDDHIPANFGRLK
jgi:hypothetical protein